jgi:hypothetical protein
VFEFGPGGPWLDQLAAAELPPPPAGTRIWPADPGRIVDVDLDNGTTTQGKPVAWARCRPGWACLIIWASARQNVLGQRKHARWGWYLYDKAHIRDEPDIHAGKPGDSFGPRYLPGYETTLAEAQASLTALVARPR